MSREQKVQDLYDRVKTIDDADAFQRVIGQESEDYVLADLRDRFWGGQGEKPWQVREINRLLTSRKNFSGSFRSPGEVSAERRLSLKERLENNLVIFSLTMLITGFVTGVGAYQGASKFLNYTTISNDTLQTLRESIEEKNNEITMLTEGLKQAQASHVEQRWLRIRGIEGLDGARARLIARVNGRAYSYPSRSVWSRLGPGMSKEDFPLPVDTTTYDISFELLTLLEDNQFRQFQSQEVVTVKSWPFEAEYKIFAVTIEAAGSTRGVPRPGAPTVVDAASERSVIARVDFEVR